jgi:cell division protein FtsX
MKRGILNIRRERGWLTTTSALLGVVLLAQIFLVLSFGVQGIQHLLRSQTDLRLEIKSDAADQRIQEFFAAVRQLPYVDEAVYVTKEQAYERERERDPALVAFLEEFQLENPFPDTVAVTLASLDDYEAFVGFAKDSQWQGVVDPEFLSKVTDQETQVHELLQVASSGRSITLFFLVLVAVLLLVVLMELVRRRSLARAEEIIVERLVGAHQLAVLVPFATEAAVLLLISFLIAAVLIVGLLFVLPTLIPALAAGGAFASLRLEVEQLLQAYAPIIFLIELFAIPVLAFVGAWLGMRPQLKTSRLALATY